MLLQELVIFAQFSDKYHRSIIAKVGILEGKFFMDLNLPNNNECYHVSA